MARCITLDATSHYLPGVLAGIACMAACQVNRFLSGAWKTGLTGTRALLAMRHADVHSLMVGEWNIFIACNLRQSSTDDYDALDMASVAQSHGANLIAHACLGLIAKYLSPFVT